jgi:DNA helicase-2/ATP-dependent DNA helicase PcrA
MNLEQPERPWHNGVKGTQVLPIIDCDDAVIRVEAGPGTGKSFGLVRRVQRILHPQGLNVPGDRVLVVAFNRVIAKQLRSDIEKCLADSPHNGDPIIQTVHALCLRVIGTQLRILLPHEREAMLYDVLCEFSDLRETYGTHRRAEQALRDHEAKHVQHMQLWQAVQQWLTRHQAQLISDLPGLLLDRLHAGDLMERRYGHIIVDEFQDLTPGEQKLFAQLGTEDGSFVALGDPRQSIYRFRGNDIGGLAKLEELLGVSGDEVKDITMTECQRCPEEIVEAANQLMGLYETQPMTSGSQAAANVHVVVFESLEAEARTMAKAIVDNIGEHPQDPLNDHITHLAMVTRRQFGYRLREEISRLAPELRIDLSFSESLLETWAVREAFLFFCLLADPDAPSWRAWLGYQDPVGARGFKAPKRNADAYLQFLSACKDSIDEVAVQQLADKPSQPPGRGGRNLWERAKRYVELKTQLQSAGEDDLALVKAIFDATQWGVSQSPDAETATLDMGLILSKTLDIYKELGNDEPDSAAQNRLRKTAQRLRYQIATREPFAPEEAADLQIATLWGAKGVTAEHVYVIGLCREAIPGTRREEYPGTDLEFVEEQRRLFYVSITRSRRTLVLSRTKRVREGKARQLALSTGAGHGGWVELEMSPFLRDVINLLPAAVRGDEWAGCV